MASSLDSQSKTTVLKQAAAKLDLVKLLVRLAYETDSLKDQQYLRLEEAIQEIGKMLGGWIRYTKL